MGELEERAEEKRKLIVTTNNLDSSNAGRRECVRPQPRSEEDLKPMVKFKAKEETFGSKLKKAIFGDEKIENIPEHLILKVAIPALKQTFYDMFCLGLSAAFNVDYDRKRSRKEGYSGYYRSERRRDDEEEEVDDSCPDSYRDIWFETREEANEIYQTMLETAEDRGYISVWAYYRISDRKCPHSDRDKRRGWYKEDLRHPELYKRHGRWYIDLCMPRHIDAEDRR